MQKIVEYYGGENMGGIRNLEKVQHFIYNTEKVKL
jgi:hypothetical protein